nr:prepilin peptidase [uncultured Gellertiella sp.]
MVTAVIFAIFPFCLAMAAFNDLFTMTIPNRIPVIILAAFVLTIPFTGMGFADVAGHVGASLVTLALCLALFSCNQMGGGDAKLLTACAIWFGFNMSLLEFAVYVSFLGGLLTVLIVILRSQAQAIMAMGIHLPGSLLVAKKIPYGIAIAAAGFMAFPSSPMMVGLLGQAIR